MHFEVQMSEIQSRRRLNVAILEMSELEEVLLV